MVTHDRLAELSRQSLFFCLPLQNIFFFHLKQAKEALLLQFFFRLFQFFQ